MVSRRSSVLPFQRWLGAQRRQRLRLWLTLVRRELEAQYQGSVLGNAWPLLNQLSQLLIYTYIFSMILKTRPALASLGDSTMGYGLWLFSGLLPWIAFTNGFSRAATAVIRQPNLVKKVVFPLGLLPLVDPGVALVESAFGTLVLLAATAIAGVNLQGALWLPLLWLPQFLLTAGLAYLLAGLTVYLRDIPQIVGVSLNLWFYLTPIVYPLTLIPEPLRGWLLTLNPMAQLVELYRSTLFEQQFQSELWFQFTAIALVLFWAGRRCFQRLQPGFSDIL
ncbi:ABC transporter permease [Synechococcus elongatus]|uniref:ABC transporter permease protein n=2 Tax=Synechococcus elongatus TaxID=32046 RepID=Q31P63_SYNE7|nr:ABC transporter permease [Synechococcus elongatus]ABB57156.1 ABC transporter permease protein [Synechococcus elongatus PCC 7942 = FACHB-805]AJD58329.1 ABC transporter permease [Synechococcus elongatus UTEX 2973]MBD2587557.1 ABC transporter permease [Synechococcus elongatus FACHB-242]MBD2688664.1 ABC transporter permease [Synechococcus elongatus FACHB-1061]MBD2707735.1 ABC transporter permease [Synechococcus elongatus PCC 7942 = FACHB-805]